MELHANEMEEEKYDESVDKRSRGERRRKNT
jgi:hypothetical protein